MSDHEQQDPRKPSPSDSTPRRREPVEDTSFSALAEDLPDAPAAHEPIPDKMEEYGDLSPEDVLRLQEKAEMDERLNSRVLAAGAVDRKPMHVSSLFLGVLSIGMYAFSGGTAPLVYVVMIIGLGGVAWGATGALRSDDPALNRGLCGAGAAMSALALLLAFL